MKYPDDFNTPAFPAGRFVAVSRFMAVAVMVLFLGIGCLCGIILWAKKSEKSKHYFNYELMKAINGGTQMRDVWTLPAIAKWEKSCGKHPTQKPLPLLGRIILASTKEHDWILDPFCGSSTTGVAASLLNRRFLGLDREEDFLILSRKRREEIDDWAKHREYLGKMAKFCSGRLDQIEQVSEKLSYYGADIPLEAMGD